MKPADRRRTLFSSLLVVAVLASPLAAAEPPKLPDTPAGHRMSAYLAAFNSDEPGALEAFLRAAFSPAVLAERPIEPRLAFHHEVRTEQGGLEVLKIVDSQPTELTLEVRGTKSGDRLKLGIEVEPSEPFLVRGFRMELDAGGPEPPASAPASRISLAEAKAAIDAEISDAAKEERFSGVVVIRRGETPWYKRAVGSANREAAISNRPETRFNLGSIQKYFTQVVIARLCQDGKLRLDDKLIEALPGYPNSEVARKVTIRQLVEHKAGFGDVFGPEFRAEPKKLRTLADYLQVFVDRPLLFEPGTKSEYSNAGFVVLGKVIEAKTGLTYDEAVRRWVFEPAGMMSTRLDPVENEAADRAVGYWKPDGRGTPWKSNRDVLPGKGSSAGGSYSTAADLVRFVDALRADRLLSFGWTEWMLRQPAPTAGAAGTSAPAGARHRGSLIVAGGAEGLNAVLSFSAEDGSVTVVLSNFDEPSAERTFERIRGILGRVAS